MALAASLLCSLSPVILTRSPSGVKEMPFSVRHPFDWVRGSWKSTRSAAGIVPQKQRTVNRIRCLMFGLIRSPIVFLELVPILIINRILLSVNPLSRGEKQVFGGKKLFFLRLFDTV